jgi:hypothetical protein
VHCPIYASLETLKATRHEILHRFIPVLFEVLGLNLAAISLCVCVFFVCVKEWPRGKKQEVAEMGGQCRKGLHNL